MNFYFNKKKLVFKTPFIFGFVFLLNSCEKNDLKLAISAETNSSVAFELRDFSQTQQVFTYGTASSTRYTGRGTLVTRDRRLSAGRAQVWLRADTSSIEDPAWTDETEIQDGIGTIKTIGSSTKNDPRPFELSNWTVLGYYVLKPGVTVDQNAATFGDINSVEKTNIARFQIRDFSQKETKGVDGNLSFYGKGTLIALDEQMKQGSYVVKLKAHRTNVADAEESNQVLLRDGIGTFDTFATQEKDETQRGKVQYGNWRIEGYAPFLLGRIVEPNKNGELLVNQENGNVAQFELRDFALERQDLAGLGSKVYGRGTLVAKDVKLRNGNVLVWLKCNTTQYGGNTRTFTLVLRDGLATISTHDYEFKSNPDSAVSYSDWQLVGYVPLQQGELVRAEVSK